MEEFVTSTLHDAEFDLDAMLCRIDFCDNDCNDESSYGTSSTDGAAEPPIDTFQSSCDEIERFATATTENATTVDSK